MLEDFFLSNDFYTLISWHLYLKFWTEFKTMVRLVRKKMFLKICRASATVISLFLRWTYITHYYSGHILQYANENRILTADNFSDEKNLIYGEPFQKEINDIRDTYSFVFSFTHSVYVYIDVKNTRNPSENNFTVPTRPRKKTDQKSTGTCKTMTLLSLNVGIRGGISTRYLNT